jgi:hypothetical protein
MKRSPLALGPSERDGMIMKLVVGVAGIVFILFLVTSVAAQISGLSQAVAPHTATTEYDSGDPTPEEQLVLEYINRARADPRAEGVRLRNDANYLWQNLPNASSSSAVGVRPPLAMNKALLLSARFHNDDMYKNGFFGHQDTVYGSAWARMMKGFGYPLLWGGENIGAWGSPTTAEDELMMDGDCLDSNACIHRINLFSSSFEEVGIGWLATAGYLTQDFGSQNPASGNPGPFLIGVVYNDVNGNNFYDIGEGISGVTITPSTGTYYAVTSTSGGYAFPIGTSGTITVTASGSGLGSISKTVTLTGANIKLDFTLQDHSTLMTTTNTTGAQTGETQTSTTNSETLANTSTRETQTSTSISITPISMSTTETRATTSSGEIQTSTSISVTRTSTSTSETQTATSIGEKRATTNTGETQTNASISGTRSSTTTSETQVTPTTSETRTTTVSTFVTNPTSMTSIVTTADTTTNVASSPPLPLSSPNCVIATATFGSALAPEVVYMRYVRDQLIGSTPSGRTLIEAFNTFYYAWSPAVAEVIAGNGLLRAVFRIILLPLMGIVRLSAMIFRTVALTTGQRDQASVFAFVGAAVMTISVYIALPIAAVAKSKQTIRELIARVLSRSSLPYASRSHTR